MRITSGQKRWAAPCIHAHHLSSKRPNHAKMKAFRGGIKETGSLCACSYMSLSRLDNVCMFCPHLQVRDSGSCRDSPPFLAFVCDECLPALVGMPTYIECNLVDQQILCTHGLAAHLLSNSHVSDRDPGTTVTTRITRIFGRTQVTIGRAECVIQESAEITATCCAFNDSNHVIDAMRMLNSRREACNERAIWHVFRPAGRQTSNGDRRGRAERTAERRDRERERER